MPRSPARATQADRRRQSYIEPPFNEADVSKVSTWVKNLGVKAKCFLTTEGGIQINPQFGCVYFIRAHDFVKIGFTVDVSKRIGGIQTGCPYPIELLFSVPGTVQTEREFHHRFRNQRQNGEWFKIEGALADFIQRGGK